MNVDQEYKAKGYSEAEVEILLTLNTLKNEVDRLKKFVEATPTDYVRRAEFEPIQKLVYGVVALILVAVMSGVVALVIK